MPRDAITVVFAADNNFVSPLGVSLLSLLEHTSVATALDVYVLDGGIEDVHQQTLRQMVQPYPACRLHFMVIDPEEFKNFPLFSSYFTATTYYRLKLANLLPEVEKAIYLDADILVTGDIADLWRVPLEDCPVAAVEEPQNLNQARFASLGLTDDHAYFNAGVLVMNLALIRRKRLEERFMAYIDAYRDVLTYQDQDVLNACLSGQWTLLPPQWNKMPFLHQKGHTYRRYTQADLVAAKAQGGILHFNGSVKPWKVGCPDPRRYVYRAVSRRTGLPVTPFDRVTLQNVVAFLRWRLQAWVESLSADAVYDVYDLRRRFGLWRRQILRRKV